MWLILIAEGVYAVYTRRDDGKAELVTVASVEHEIAGLLGIVLPDAG